MSRTKPPPPIQEAEQALRERLIRGRTALGLSQAEFARRAQVSRPIISAIELGRANPSLKILKRLAVAIGCDVVSLFKAHGGRLRPRDKGSTRRAGHIEARYSRSGRKPSLKTWLENPPPESRTAAAKAFGVDLTLLAQNLALSPAQRLRKLSEGAATLQWLRKNRRNQEL